VTRRMKVLIAEDDPTLRSFLEEVMKSNGATAASFGDGISAMKKLESDSFDLFFCDVRLPGAGGLDVLKFAREKSPGTRIVMMTAFATIDIAVDAMKTGAFDFLQKPFTAEIVENILKKAEERIELEKDIQALKRNIPVRRLVGTDKGMKNVIELIDKVARGDAGVLILGESGVGKELVALEIHARSNRAVYRFVPVNISSIPDTMVEAELFGHEKGAFTGALKERTGLLELADGGTLFLDEVGDLSNAMQTKLLRFLQERKFRRIGSNEERDVDVRVIGATNKDLQKEVNEGRFREDLFYRLNVVPINVPPLRDRVEDIPDLVEYFISIYAAKMKAKVRSVSPQVMDEYSSYRWPGNVRELENVISRALALETGSILEKSYLDLQLTSNRGYRAKIMEGGFCISDYIFEIEKDSIQYALELENGVKVRAAERLGLKRTTLIEKMKRLGMEE